MNSNIKLVGYDYDNKLYRTVSVFSDGSIGTSYSSIGENATSSNQTIMITKLQELNDSNNTEENFNTSALSFNNTVSHNTNNYSKYSLIVNSTADDTKILIQASHDDTNWYNLDYSSTVNYTYDADNTSGLQYNYNTNGTPVAKYLRLRIYTPTAADVKTIFNLIH